MMKNVLYVFVISVLIFAGNTIAQTSSNSQDWLAKKSWSFGVGLRYPRYISTDVRLKGVDGYGGYLSIQRNFTEHVGLRFMGSYNHLQGQAGTPLVTIKNNFIEGDFDLLYYMVPCEAISPYLSVGVGGVYYTITNSPIANVNKSSLDYTFNLGFGAEWRVAPNLHLNTALDYHTIGTSKFDGIYGTVSGGILGGNTDSYMAFNLGINYYFGKQGKSHLCDIYNGIGQVDYNRIEDIVKKYATQPTEVDYNRIEDIVKRNKPTIAAAPSNWVLIGVNFGFNKSTLRPESLPILYNAAEILLTHPGLKIEIIGYTDNIGSERYNKNLSLRRAETVRNFLIAKGISANRLSVLGMGETDPIATNKTAEGRGLNRRIEFKVISK